MISAALVLLLPLTALAVGQNAPLDLNRFHPAPGTGRLLTIDRADVGGRLELVPQLVLHYADRPLVFQENDRQQLIVQNRLTADFAVALSLLGRLQLSLALPVTLYQQGSAVTYTDPTSNTQRTLPQPARGGQEDLRVGVKGLFWRNTRFGAGGALDIVFPTGDGNSYLGSRSVTGNARLLGHFVYRRLTLALNVGWHFAFAEERILNVRAGNSLVYGAGVEVEVARPGPARLSVLAEIYGLAFRSFDRAVSSPVEAIVALKARVGRLSIFGGAGPGLDSGYGEPRFRLLAGVAYVFHPVARPRPLAQPAAPRPAPAQPPPLPPPAVSVPEKSDRLHLEEPIFFDFDRDTIREVSYPLLDQVVRLILEHPEYGPIRIDGHTDDVGTEAYNLELSLRRARAVYRYLVAHGIAANRLSHAGYGKRCPVLRNDTEENRAINRRVDFILVDREQHHPAPGECPDNPVDSPTAP